MIIFLSIHRHERKADLSIPNHYNANSKFIQVLCVNFINFVDFVNFQQKRMGKTVDFHYNKGSGRNEKGREGQRGVVAGTSHATATPDEGGGKGAERVGYDPPTRQGCLQAPSKGERRAVARGFP